MFIQSDIIKLAGEIVEMAERARKQLHELRAPTQDRPPVFNEVVALEMDLIGLKSEVLKLKSYVSAANNLGVFPKGPEKPPDPYPDRLCAAAHDDSLFDNPIS